MSLQMAYGRAWDYPLSGFSRIVFGLMCGVGSADEEIAADRGAVGLALRV